MKGLVNRIIYPASGRPLPSEVIKLNDMIRPILRPILIYALVESSLSFVLSLFFSFALTNSFDKYSTAGLL